MIPGSGLGKAQPGLFTAAERDTWTYVPGPWRAAYGSDLADPDDDLGADATAIASTLPLRVPVDYDLAATAWTRDAACAQHPEVSFFPDSRRSSARDEPMAICARCPVVDACLDYAITNEISEGIFGGMLPAERSELTGLGRVRSGNGAQRGLLFVARESGSVRVGFTSIPAITSAAQLAAQLRSWFGKSAVLVAYRATVRRELTRLMDLMPADRCVDGRAHVFQDVPEVWRVLADCDLADRSCVRGAA